MPYGQYFGSDGRGGYTVIDGLTDEIRIKATPLMRFRQFARLVPKYGAKMGDTVYFNKYSALATGAQSLSEFVLMPEDNFTITRGSITVGEYGNSVPITERLINYGAQDIETVTHELLLNDIAKKLDTLAGTAVQSTDLVYSPTGSTSAPSYTLATNGSAGATATRNGQMYDVKNIRDYFRKNNVAPFDDGMYVAVCSTTFLRGIEDDPDFEEALRYGAVKRLFLGEVGEIAGVRFLRETNVLSDSCNGGLGEAVFFGKDVLYEAIALQEEIRVEEPRDMGRSRRVGWLYRGGFAAPWDYSTDGECHIIRVYG